jgi:hypothetical protein
MNGGQERYWLVKQSYREAATDERRAKDFVCCEVPVGGDVAMALEVFTSREGAEAELRGMERLASGKYSSRAAHQYRDRFAERKQYETPSERVVELVEYELVEMLDDPGIPYVLLDPPPVDEPISEALRIELTLAFADKLSRRLGVIKKGRV